MNDDYCSKILQNVDRHLCFNLSTEMTTLTVPGEKDVSYVIDDDAAKKLVDISEFCMQEAGYTCTVRIIMQEYLGKASIFMYVHPCTLRISIYG